jgi:hypothetical protein
MKKLALVLFLVLAAAGLWWWESPRLATENLLDAAHDRDVAELEQLIDVAKFQASLRALPEWPDAPPRVDAPASHTDKDMLLAELAGEADMIALRRSGRTNWEIERHGLNRFRVLRRESDGAPLPPLLFARDGLHWKLVGAEQVR